MTVDKIRYNVPKPHQVTDKTRMACPPGWTMTEDHTADVKPFEHFEL